MSKENTTEYFSMSVFFFCHSGGTQHVVCTYLTSTTRDRQTRWRTYPP